MRVKSRRQCVLLMVVGILVTYILLFNFRIDLVVRNYQFPISIGNLFTKPYQLSPWKIVPAKKSVQDIYYVKIHKTGSTTLQNVIARYGIKKNLSFVPFNCAYGMTFPNPPYQQYVLEDAQNERFNILAEHTRFEPYPYKSYMAENTVIISQLRHPMKFLTSLFGFEFLYKRFELNQPGINPIRTFLENPEKYDEIARWEAGSKKCTPRQQPSFTKNSMAFHLGYTESQSTVESVREFLLDLDKRLLFVVITEKFEESMVLLKKLFRWDLEDILYLSRGSLAFHDRKRFEVGKNESDLDHLIDLHMHWSPVDYILYNHFHEKLLATLSIQEQSFWGEVEYFQSTVQSVKTFCEKMCESVSQLKSFITVEEAREFLQSSKFKVNASAWNKEFNVTHLDCVQMMLVTEDYQFAIRAKEAPVYCEGASTGSLNVGFDKTFCKKEHHLVYTFPWAYVKNQLFQSYNSCMKYVNG